MESDTHEPDGTFIQDVPLVDHRYTRLSPQQNAIRFELEAHRIDFSGFKRTISKKLNRIQTLFTSNLTNY